MLPHLSQHVVDDIEQRPAWLQRGDEISELAFDLLFTDGFVALAAALGLAEVIRVPRTAPFGPAGGQGVATLAAFNKSAQGEVRIDVRTERRAWNAVETLLYLLEGLKADERLMLAGMQMQVPFLERDIAGVERTTQQFGDQLNAHLAMLVARRRGKAFEEPLDLADGLEAPRSETLESLTDDRCVRLVRHQHLPVHVDLFVAIANDRREYVVPGLHPRLHPVDDLFGVLLPRMLRDGSEQVLNEDRVRVLAELDRRAFQPRACLRDRSAQFEMRLHVPGQTADVIDDDNVIALGFVFPEKGEHGLHAWAINHSARYALVTKRLCDVVALAGRKIPAAGFLRAETVTARDLRGG